MERQREGLSKRDFLLAACAGVFAITNSGIVGEVLGAEDRRAEQYLATHHYDATLELEVPNHPETLTFEELANLDLRLGRVYKQLDLDNWKVKTDKEYVDSWTEEVADQIVAEGFADYIRAPGTFEYFRPLTGRDVNHVLGYTYCDDELYLNSRLTSPASDWYESPWLLTTIVHEMIHLEAQGEDVCGHYPSDLIEATAQIGMLETLAGMANRGNKEAFKTFVYEYYDMVDRALLLTAKRKNRLEDYQKIRRTIEGTAFDEARDAKMMWRDWENDEWEIDNILEKYALDPVTLMVNAHIESENVVKGLALQPILSPRGGFSHTHNPRSIKIDDWAYIMAHLEEMAREAK